MEWRIKDPIKMIEECQKNNEPIFVLRAQDLCALHAIREYNRICIHEKVKATQLLGSHKVEFEFRDWQNANQDKVKLPD